MNSTSRSYCFTINRYLERLAPDMDKIRYLVAQVEIAPLTGHEHIQGYAELLKPMKPLGFIKALGYTSGAEVHVEKRKGTAKQAREYCMKEDTRKAGSAPLEFGEWKEEKQGKRTDLDAAAVLAKTYGVERVAEDMAACYIKYSRGLENYVDILQPRRRFGDQVELHVRWGPTGTGKSHYVHEKHGADVYVKDPCTKWWDGYKGQKVVLIDDFEGEINLRLFLTWIDKYPCRVEKKGMSTSLNARIFYVTSNLHYETWWTNKKSNHTIAEYIAPLVRRITTTTHCTDKYVEPVPSTAIVVYQTKCPVCNKDEIVCGGCLD